MNSKWDIRFLRLAREVSSWSKDPSTKVGAVIVAPNKSVVSLGYNGFPRTMEDRPEWYADRTEKYSRIIHAEINALLQARQSVAGCTLYTWPLLCCDRCVVQMLQAGIQKFISVTPLSDTHSRWGTQLTHAKAILSEIETVTWTEYDLQDRDEDLNENN